MKRIALASLATIALAACAQNGSLAQEDTVQMSGPADGVYPSMMRAEADMIGDAGTSIGSANLIGGPNGILLRIELDRGALTPGWHGLHLHQVGDCSDTGTFKRSGGHVGMIDGGHGLLNPAGPEGGDIPNIWVSADGSAGYEVFTDLTEMSALTDADGAAIIIHENEDDHLSQPIGGAGARVACGVVK